VLYSFIKGFIMSVFAKDPQSEVDFSLDWTDWITSGEVITSALWSIDPSDVSAPTLGASQSSGSVQSVYVSGGVPGSRYRLSCQIQTDAGRTADRSLTLRIMEQ
jgi:hypothetical protein